MNTCRIMFLILVIAVSLPASAVPADIESILGDWAGTLSFSGMELRIVFHVASGEEGALTVTMDSPDQGAAGIPASGTEFRDDSLIVEVAVASGGYAGKYDPERDVIDGEWRQAGFVLPLLLERTAGVSPPSRPQEPERPLPYREEEVEFQDQGAGVTLSGTLTIPEGEGPFPAVVLISGSGPQDRDESILGHKPFLVLSDHLTRRGIAVLRYDDRGVGKSGGDHASATTRDFAADARAAFEYLVSRVETDPSWTGLAGHSEGGIISAMVASEYDDVAFIVLLAGPGLPGSEILLRQNIVLLKHLGAPEDVLRKREEQLRREYRLLYKSWDDERVRSEIIKRSTPYLDRYTDKEKEDFGFSGEAVRQRARTLTTPWFRFFMTYDPAKALSKVHCPVLAMIGGKDMQVDPGENIPAIKKALSKARNRHYRVEELPGLNHLFQSAETGSPTEYARIEETMSPAAMDMVSGWILSLKGAKR